MPTSDHAAAPCLLFFFFNDPATTEIYTLSLHDALPIFRPSRRGRRGPRARASAQRRARTRPRSEEHTSELQSHVNLVCRLLLEKKKQAIHVVASPRVLAASVDDPWPLLAQHPGHFALTL